MTRALERWVDGVRRHAQAISIAILITTLLLVAYTALNLRINSDNLSLIPANLPSRQAHEAFIEQFPNLEEAIFVVVDAETPELARAAAGRLTERLAAEPEHFTEVYEPAGGDFFERNGLLYRSPDELDHFADQLARIQPMIAELERDPSIAQLAEVVRLALDDLEAEGDQLEQWTMVLDRVSQATVSVYDEYPLAVSWEEVLLRGSSLEIATRRAIVVHPVLDYGDILQGRRPIDRIRAITAELGFVPEHGVRVRVTGNPALNYEEMIGIAWDIGFAGVFCFALVALVLHRALRSVRLVIAALTTLLVGLIWTAAFATVAVGQVNLVSITFAILFIGLGVDFGIHLGMGYADLLRDGRSHEDALREATSRIGGALLLCSLTTAIGFYVFVPADYRGVSELGLIAGSSMFIILFLTLTFLPALLSAWLRLDPERDLGKPLHFAGGWHARVARHNPAIRRIAVVAAAAGTALLPGVRFDANVIEMRDPSTESVQAFQDLLERTDTTPWYLNVVTADLDSAVQLAARIDSLDSVERAITLASFVPEDQDEKLEILSDIAFFFDNPGVLENAADAIPVEQQVAALRTLHAHLERLELRDEQAALAPSVARLREHLQVFLERVAREERPEQALAELEQVLLGPLPEQLARLRQALEADEIEIATLPPELVRRMRAPDGRSRVQVFPSIDMGDIDDFRRFVSDVQSFAPGAAGVPLNLIEFGDLVDASFTQALASALVLISILLFVLWRSVTRVLMVMAPLILGAILTGATMAVLGITFNFTNVVVIPLLLGIGVDSGIHLMQRSQEDLARDQDLLGTATARAVYYSAITTIVSFGSMSLAGHNGLKSLGLTLTFGLIYTVGCVLFLLPALLELRAANLSGQVPSPP